MTKATAFAKWSGLKRLQTSPRLAQSEDKNDSGSANQLASFVKSVRGQIQTETVQIVGPHTDRPLSRIQISRKVCDDVDMKIFQIFHIHHQETVLRTNVCQDLFQRSVHSDILNGIEV